MAKWSIMLMALTIGAVYAADISPASTNVSSIVTTATTNASAVKLAHQQCEAVTKSGTRCKRNAAPGEKLCRQHKKIAAKKAK